MEDINLRSIWDDIPAVSAWLDRIKGTEPFGKTYYHGSLLTEKYPHLEELARSKAEKTA